MSSIMWGTWTKSYFDTVKQIKKSLKTLKSELSRKEAINKLIQHHYPHLSVCSQDELLTHFQLSTLDELQEYIQSAISSSDDPRDNDTLCSCKDSNGEYKELYTTNKLAKEQADRSMEQQRIELKVYPCPYGYGWHLTKV